MEEGAWKSFLKEMEALLGEGYPAYLASFSQPWYRGLRVNTGKVSPAQMAALLETAWKPHPKPREDLLQEEEPSKGLLREEEVREDEAWEDEAWEDEVPKGSKRLAPVPWIANGYYYDPGWAAAKDPYYYAGLYYLQEPSAMTPASRLPVEPGDRVLDLCAAPGGKATELGVRLQGKGLLFANDISNSRAKALLKNLELFGIGNICVTSESPQKLAEELPGFFDKILVDAPCSGEGMFRREPDMIKDWAERGPAYYAPIQQDILCRAVKLLKPGGFLLYSTCTFSKKEDEENVLWLLAQFPEMELVPLAPFHGSCDGFGMSGVLRLFPHKIKGEGHFLALLRKKACEGAGERSERLSDMGERGADLPKEAYGSRRKRGKGRGAMASADLSAEKERLPAGLGEFLTELGIEPSLKLETERIRKLQDKLYYLPEGFPEGAKLRYLRTGLYLGDLKKGRFEPSQALAMVVKPAELSCAIRLSHEDERVIRYLKGETIFYEAEDGAGWRLVCLEEYPLGWAKKSGGVLKNKYYPGWRVR